MSAFDKHNWCRHPNRTNPYHLQVNFNNLSVDSNMQCTKFACDHDGDVLDIQTTTTYDAFGNVVSVIEQNTTNDLTEDADSWCFDGLEMDVDDDALQYHQARFYDPTQGEREKGTRLVS